MHNKDIEALSAFLNTNLANNMLHDLNGQVGLLLANLSLAQNRYKELSEESIDLITSIERAFNISKQLANKIDRVSSLAIQATAEYETDLLDLLDEIIFLLDKDDKILFKKHVMENLPKVRINHYSARMAFENILINAIEAIKTESEEGEIHIEITKSKRNILIYIKDSGPGFTDYDKEKLFKENHSTKPYGLGIGLIISKKFFNSIGGELVLHDTSKQGTSFLITIPITPGD